MAVFAHDIGLVGILCKILMDLLNGRVHAAVQIYVGIIIFFIFCRIAGTLIMCQPCMVKFLCPGKRRLKSASICTFVSHGPDHHAGAVLIPVNTALCPVHSGLCKSRVVCNGMVPSGCSLLPGVVLHIDIRSSVALIVSFIYNKETVFVAELIELRRIWIMAGTDAVDIMLFHEL